MVSRFGVSLVVAMLVALSSHGTAITSPVAEDWIALRPGGGGQSATDNAGNTYIRVGSTISRYNAAGVETWSRPFSPCGAPCGSTGVSDVATNASGSHVWIAGGAGPLYDEDWYVTQYDAVGTQRWIRWISGAANVLDSARAIAIDAVGNVYATGQIRNGSHYDLLTAKYDIDGNLQWSRTFDSGRGGHDYGEDIDIDASGRAYVAETGSITPNAEDFGFLIYDSAGTQLCFDGYDGGSNDIPSAVAALPGGGAYLTGRTMTPPSFDFLTFKYTSGCGREWARSYNSGFDDDAYRAGIDSTGGVYISGLSGPGTSPPPAKGIVTIRYDGAGNLLWTNRLDGSAGKDDRIMGMDAHSTGVVITGYVFNTGTGADWLTAAYSLTGTLLWSRTFSGSAGGDDYPLSVSIDSAGSVYVAGWVEHPGGAGALIKYAPDDDDDGVPNHRDNCPDVPNPNQENAVHPGTLAGDHCEDPDADALVDAVDSCPDDRANDVDADGVCVGPTFQPPRVGANDNCANVANPGQENGDGDQWGDACDECPTVPTPWWVPPQDFDCDGWDGAGETWIGTDVNDSCADTTEANDERGPAYGQPLSPWPPDINDDRRVTLPDVTLFAPWFNQIGPNPPNPLYNPRFDLNADNKVNLPDVTMLGPFFNQWCVMP